MRRRAWLRKKGRRWKLRLGKEDSGSGGEGLTLWEVGEVDRPHGRWMSGCRLARRALEPSCDSVTRPWVSPPWSGWSWSTGIWRGQ